MAKTLIKIKDLRKSFGTKVILDGLNLEIKEGEFFTIVGPSGSGKSTLIRLLVGMWTRRRRQRRHRRCERPAHHAGPVWRSLSITVEHRLDRCRLTSWVRRKFALLH